MRLALMFLILVTCAFGRGVHVSIRTKINPKVAKIHVPKVPKVKHVEYVYTPARVVPARVSVDHKGLLHFTHAHVSPAKERKVIR